MPNSTPLNLPSHYPQWVQDFFNAPTEDLPGFFGDWWDIGVKVVETDRSISVFDIPGIGMEPNPEPTATFYGDQYCRRAMLIRFLSETIVACLAMNAIAASPGDAWKCVAELPLRLTFSEDYANEVFGGPWK